MSVEESDIPSSPETTEPGEITAPAEAVLPLKRILEAILFSSQKPLSPKELRSVLKGAAEGGDPSAVSHAKTKEADLVAAFEELASDCESEGRTYELRETAAGWQLVTRIDFAPWLRQLYPENRSARISAPAMETLAIIAYRQPITRADIEAVRGVAVDGVMQTLLDRGLVRIAGRAEVPGRPLLYQTTQFFMEHFGIKNLNDLPNAQELRRIELPKAEEPKPAPPENELPFGPAEPEPSQSKESGESNESNESEKSSESPKQDDPSGNPLATEDPAAKAPDAKEGSPLQQDSHTA